MSLFVAEYVVRFADGGGMELVKQRVHMVRGDWVFDALGINGLKQIDFKDVFRQHPLKTLFTSTNHFLWK